MDSENMVAVALATVVQVALLLIPTVGILTNNFTGISHLVSKTIACAASSPGAMTFSDPGLCPGL